MEDVVARTARLAALLCMSVLIGGCSEVSVEYDYDPKVDFAALKKFDWLPIPVKPTISRLTVERMKKAVSY